MQETHIAHWSELAQHPERIAKYLENPEDYQCFFPIFFNIFAREILDVPGTKELIAKIKKYDALKAHFSTDKHPISHWRKTNGERRNNFLSKMRNILDDICLSTCCSRILSPDIQTSR